MVYGIILLINFAHGDILMAGAYAAFYVLGFFGVTPLGVAAAFIFAMGFCGMLGAAIERFAYRPLRDSPRLNSLITAIAISLILQNAARLIPFIGPNPRQFPRPDVKLISAAGFSISNIQIIVIFVSAFLMIVLNYIINKTKRGRAMRAVSYDAKAASLMGVNVDGVISFTFALGSMLAACGGILYAFSYPQISPAMGAMPGLKAFIAAVIGGIGSIPGAMLGGVLLGLTETFTKSVNSQYADAISFSLLIIMLLVRPSGIMGSKLKVKV
jgi:branched-chain amino acid transport system permease protein